MRERDDSKSQSEPQGGFATEPFPTAPSLQRVVGVSGVAFSSFNGIVGAGIFGLPALVAALLGPAAILAYLVCVVLVGLVGLCFAESGSRVTSAGGLYAYARIPFGLVVGGIAGTLSWSSYALSNAAIANFLTDTFAPSWPALEGGAPRVLFSGVRFCAAGRRQHPRHARRSPCRRVE